MQSIVLRSGLLSLLIACNGNVGTPQEEDSEKGNQPGAEIAHGPGISPAATRDTEVTFNVGGLASWAAGDSLQLVVPGAGTAQQGIENQFAAYPRAGETTIAAQAINWKHVGAPLVDAGKGEAVVLAQLVAASSGGRSYAALARAGTAHGLTLRNGAAGSLAATLLPVPQDRTLALQWKGGELAALAAQAGPGAEAGPAATVTVNALPDGGARTDFTAAYHGGLPSLVVFPPLPTESFEQTVRYGNPFTAKGWSERATAVYTASVPVPTKDGVGSVAARFVASVPVTSKAVTLGLLLSPVRNVALGGVALDAPRTGAGRSPTLSWQAPSLGEATSYTVVLSAVEGSDQGVTIKAIDSFTTKATSLQLPLLAAGTTYVATITATSGATSGAGANQAFASADYVTAQLTP